MKKFFIFLTSMFMIFGIYCGNDGNSDDSGPRLNILKGNSAFVQSSGNLAQIGSRTSMSNAVKDAITEGTSLTTVTTQSGQTLTVSAAIAVNSAYVFLKDVVTEDELIPAANYILNIDSGSLTALPVWPDNLRRISANSTDAFFISGGGVYSVKLADGVSTLISEKGSYWTYNHIDGYSVSSEAWTAQNMVYISPAGSLYIFGANSIIDSKVSHGQAAKFTFDGGAWVTDPVFNETFFKSMPSGIPDMIPGSSLSMAQWLLYDQETSKLYDIHTIPYSLCVKVYEYNLDTWTDGPLAYQAALAEDSVGSTFLGFNNTFQDSIITNGAVILKLAADTCTVTPVPADVPVSNAKTWPGNPEIFQFGEVANWNFLDGQLYILDPVDSTTVYTWDMVSTFDKSNPLQNAENMIFLY